MSAILTSGEGTKFIVVVSGASSVQYVEVAAFVLSFLFFFHVLSRTHQRIVRFMAHAGLPPVLEILEKNFCPGMSWNFESVLEFEHFLEKSWKTAILTSSNVRSFANTVPFLPTNWAPK
jgi:hypothetical protein